MEASCVRHAISSAAIHVGLPPPTHEKFCAAVRDLAASKPRIIACTHSLAWFMPTAICLRFSSGVSAVRSQEFRSAARELVVRKERFAIVIISTAAALYGVRELWSHAVSFLFANTEVEIVDTIAMFDERLTPINVDPLTLCGRLDAICVLVHNLRT